MVHSSRYAEGRSRTEAGRSHQWQTYIAPRERGFFNHPAMVTVRALLVAALSVQYAAAALLRNGIERALASRSLAYVLRMTCS